MSRKTLDPEAFQDACSRIPELTVQEVETALRTARIKLVQPLNPDHVFRLNVAFRDYVMARLAGVAVSQSRKRLQRGTLEEQARMRKYRRGVSHNRHEGDPDRAALFEAIVSVYVETVQRPAGVSRTGGKPSGPCLQFAGCIIQTFLHNLPQDLARHLPLITPETLYVAIRYNSIVSACNGRAGH